MILIAPGLWSSSSSHASQTSPLPPEPRGLTSLYRPLSICLMCPLAPARAAYGQRESSLPPVPRVRPDSRSRHTRTLWSKSDTRHKNIQYGISLYQAPATTPLIILWPSCSRYRYTAPPSYACSRSYPSSGYSPQGAVTMQETCHCGILARARCVRCGEYRCENHYYLRATRHVAVPSIYC